MCLPWPQTTHNCLLRSPVKEWETAAFACNGGEREKKHSKIVLQYLQKSVFHTWSTLGLIHAAVTMTCHCQGCS